MSITKSTYASSHSISPRFLRAERDAATGIIIIDDVSYTGSVDVHTEIDKDVAWLKITPGFEYCVLDDAPAGVTAFGPAHENWDRTRLLVHTSEAFVVLYDSTGKTQQAAVTGYAMGATSDMLYVKIDQTAGTVTIYQ